MTLRVLYRDAALLAVDKPPGLPSQPTRDPSRDSLYAAVRRLVGETAYVGQPHRLDLQTSGVSLFALDPSTAAALSAAFAERSVTKVYRALVVPTGEAELPDELTDYLAEKGRGRQRRVVCVRSGGQPARTTARVLARGERLWSVELRPQTGRRHQLRVQLASRGLPIAGDATYGGPERIGDVVVPRMMLHAGQLAVVHPVSGEPLEVVSPLPADVLQVLEALC